MNPLLPMFAAFLLLNTCTEVSKKITPVLTSSEAAGVNKKAVPPPHLPRFDFQYPQQDANGWSIINPSENSRLIYVSSGGDDDHARFYAREEIKDPFNPIDVVAFKTIAVAMAFARDGNADWLLLKRGDTWIVDAAIQAVSGQSTAAPFVVTSYGDAQKRPLIKTGVKSGILLRASKSFVTVIGIAFYAHKRDPNSSAFVGWENVGKPAGFLSLTNDSNDVESLVIENNIFEFYGNNIQINGKKNNNNIVIRRNQLLNSYSTTSHSQGLFMTYATLLLEENLFDHNGWYQQRDGRPTDKGQATIFNHNAYLTNLNNSFISGNIVARASSIGFKFKTKLFDKTNVANTYNLVIANNLFIEGEVALSIGGNEDFEDGFRWQDMNVSDNVFLHLGAARPTQRTLGWHIDASDWNTGVISGNYLLFNDSNEVKNVSGIKVKGFTKDVEVVDNVIFGLHAGGREPIRTTGDEKMENVDIHDNRVELPSFAEIERKDISTYMILQKNKGGLDAFIEAAKKQSKHHWNPAYTAHQFNAYVKSQFDPSGK